MKCTIGLVFIVNGALQIVRMYVRLPEPNQNMAYLFPVPNSAKFRENI